MLERRETYFLPCAFWIVICLAIAFLSSWVTRANLSDWYLTIQQPSFSPPSSVFGPVWTVMYILIGISGGILWRHRYEMPKAFAWYLIQLGFNFAWSFIFFGAERIGWALVDIVLLLVSIALTILFSYQQSKIVASLLAPYFLWVLYATTLNTAIWLLN